MPFAFPKAPDEKLAKTTSLGNWIRERKRRLSEVNSSTIRVLNALDVATPHARFDVAEAFEVNRLRDEKSRQLNGVKCPLTGCARMELIGHGECCDSNTNAERALVNMYGGVAYDHDSMPKVVAVHTLSPERLNTLEVGQRSSIMDGLPRCMIGIRIKPKGDLRSFADLKEQGELAKISSSFSLEQLNQRDSQHQNTIVTKPVTDRVSKKTSPPCNRLLKEHNCYSDPAMECCPSHDKNCQEKEPERMSQLCGLLLSGHVIPHGLNAQSINFSEASKSRSGNLESLHWSNIGVLAEKNPDKLNLYHHVQHETDKRSPLYLDKDLTAATGSNCQKVQATKGFNYDSVQNSPLKTMKELVGGTFVGRFDVAEDIKRYQEASSGSSETTGKSSLDQETRLQEGDKQKTDFIIPRKRPRKSIPRKVDIARENLYASFHSTDSEETLSADEVNSELSPNESTPVVSPKSSGSGSKSPRGTKVIFKRTAGVWSVSSLKSDLKESKESTDTWSLSKESDAESDQQCKKVCLFTNRPIAPLDLCDPLDSTSEEHCFSPALDREVRIKELLRKQEELLKEVRQGRATSLNNSL
ncbi:uncharacterized protein LOC144664178 [Oculina patagonica]